MATYAEKIVAEDRDLDPARSATELERVVRALSPHIGAHVKLGDGTWLGVSEARVLPADGPPAGVVSFGGAVPVLGCWEGSLELLRGAAARSTADERRGLSPWPPALGARGGSPGGPRCPRPASARSSSSAGCSNRGRTPIVRFSRGAAADARDRALATALVVRNGAAPGDARLRRGAADLGSALNGSIRRCSPRCAWACSSCCSSTVSPRTRPSTRASSWQCNHRAGANLVNAVLRRAANEGRALLEALDDATPERGRDPEFRSRRGWPTGGGRSSGEEGAVADALRQRAGRIGRLRSTR